MFGCTTLALSGVLVPELVDAGIWLGLTHAFGQALQL